MNNVTTAHTDNYDIPTTGDVNCFLYASVVIVRIVGLYLKIPFSHWKLLPWQHYAVFEHIWQCVRYVVSAEMVAGLYAPRGVEMTHK